MLTVVGLSWVFFRALSAEAAFNQLSALRNFQFAPNFGASVHLHRGDRLSDDVWSTCAWNSTGEEYPFESSRLSVPAPRRPR